MSYKELFIKTREINKNQTGISVSPIFEFIYRKVSFFITPFFIQIGISPNLISGLGLTIGLISSALIFSSTEANIRLGVIFFFIAAVVDYADGNVARMVNRSSFYGRFIDGFIDIVILCAIRLALCRFIMVKIEDGVLFWIGFTCCVLTPIHHLIYDRYSALSRWSNEENGTKIKPYIRQKASPRITFFLIDLQFLLFFLIPIFFDSSMLRYLLLFYFLTNIVSAIHTIINHILHSYRNMNFVAKAHR